MRLRCEHLPWHAMMVGSIRRLQVFSLQSANRCKEYIYCNCNILPILPDTDTSIMIVYLYVIEWIKMVYFLKDEQLLFFLRREALAVEHERRRQEEVNKISAKFFMIHENSWCIWCILYIYTILYIYIYCICIIFIVYLLLYVYCISIVYLLYIYYISIVYLVSNGVIFW